MLILLCALLERPSSLSVMSTTGPEKEQEEIPNIATLQERKGKVKKNLELTLRQIKNEKLNLYTGRCYGFLGQLQTAILLDPW